MKQTLKRWKLATIFVFCALWPATMFAQSAKDLAKEQAELNAIHCRMETELGKIVIDTDVIATYAGSVAVECFGIVGMAAVNMKDGLVKLLGRESLGHGIT